MRSKIAILGLLVVTVGVAAAGTRTVRAQANPNRAFDPPAFGIVSITPDETIRIHVVCWAHEVRGVPPGPCDGELIFHDMAGNDLASRTVRLEPGESTFLETAIGVRNSPAQRVGIDPCWLPGPGSGRALPTVEVFETLTGRTAFVTNPVAARISSIKDEAMRRR